MIAIIIIPILVVALVTIPSYLVYKLFLKDLLSKQSILKTLKKFGYTGSLSIEREVGTQQDRFNDILNAVEYLRGLDV